MASYSFCGAKVRLHMERFLKVSCVFNQFFSTDQKRKCVNFRVSSSVGLKQDKDMWQFSVQISLSSCCQDFVARDLHLSYKVLAAWFTKILTHLSSNIVHFKSSVLLVWVLLDNIVVLREVILHILILWRNYTLFTYLLLYSSSNPICILWSQIKTSSNVF